MRALLILVLTAAMASSATVYVDSAATGTGLHDGSSWTAAFPNLQSALAASAAGARVWVAAGTYRPAATDRDTPFMIPDGVVLLGGFAPGMTAESQADWQAHPTILSGDLAGDDSGFSGNAENSYHVVMLGNGCTIDGFVITGANNDGASVYGDGGGLIGGLGTSESVSHCLFAYCSSAYNGGGIFGGDNGWNVDHCAFLHCRALGTIHANDGMGGGFASYSIASLTNCVFYGCSAKLAGGGFFVSMPGPLAVSNCVFASCSASDGGGAAVWWHDGTTTFQCCTFSGCSATDAGGAMAINRTDSLAPTPTVNQSLSLVSCALWGNTAPTPSQVYMAVPAGSTGSLTVDHSVVQYGTTGVGAGNGTTVSTTALVNLEPMFVNPANPLGADGLMFTTDDGFAIADGSPAIDAGGAAPVATDITGAARPVGGAVDCGAYEHPAGGGLTVFGSGGSTAGTAGATAAAPGDKLGACGMGGGTAALILALGLAGARRRRL